MTLAATAAALKAAVENVEGLAEVYGYPEESPNAPCAIIRPDRVPFDHTYASGTGRQTWIVRVLVGRYEASESWLALYDFADATGSTSVKAALEADDTLGGVVQSLRVQEAVSFAAYLYDQMSFLGCELTVDLIP